MNTSRGSSKNRYTTGLPSSVAIVHHDVQAVAPPRVKKLDNSRQSAPRQQIEDDHESIYEPNANLRYNIIKNASEPDHNQEILRVDSLLPYQRPLRGNNAQELAARLELIEQAGSSSSDRTASSTGRSQTESSDSSNSRSGPRQDEKVELSKTEPQHNIHTNTTVGNAKSIASPQGLDINTPEEPGVPSAHKTAAPTQRSRSLSLLAKTPKRPKSSVSTERQSGSDSPSNRPVPDPNSSRKALRSSPSRLRGVQNSRILVADRLRGWRRFSRKQRTEGASPSSDVQFEKVEGVTLDTQPAAIPERQTGLSLPEIEAQDIRHIPNPTNDAQYGGQDTVSEPVDSDSFFAGAPLLSGANRQINAHTVPPGTVTEASIHAAFEGDPQMNNEDTTGLQSRSIPISSDRHEGLVDIVPPLHTPQVARHSQSSATRASLYTPITIPEDPREDLPETADGQTIDPAEPPPIALSKEFEERESRMARAIQTAKGLLGKMV